MVQRQHTLGQADGCRSGPSHTPSSALRGPGGQPSPHRRSGGQETFLPRGSAFPGPRPPLLTREGPAGCPDTPARRLRGKGARGMTGPDPTRLTVPRWAGRVSPAGPGPRWRQPLGACEGGGGGGGEGLTPSRSGGAANPPHAQPRGGSRCPPQLAGGEGTVCRNPPPPPPPQPARGRRLSPAPHLLSPPRRCRGGSLPPQAPTGAPDRPPLAASGTQPGQTLPALIAPHHQPEGAEGRPAGPALTGRRVCVC